MAEAQIRRFCEWTQIGDKAAFRWVTEVTDVMDVRGFGRQRAAQDLLKRGLVQAGPEPVEAHIGGLGRVELAPLLHRECFGKRPTVTPPHPFFLVPPRPPAALLAL